MSVATRPDEGYSRITEAEAVERHLFANARAVNLDGFVLVFDDTTMLRWQPASQLPYIPQPAGWRGGVWDERHLQEEQP